MAHDLVFLLKTVSFYLISDLLDSNSNYLTIIILVILKFKYNFKLFFNGKNFYTKLFFNYIIMAKIQSFTHHFFMILEKNEIKVLRRNLEKKEEILKKNAKSLWEVNTNMKNTTLVLISSDLINNLDSSKFTCYDYDFSDNESLFYSLINIADFLVDAGMEEESRGIRIFLSLNNLLFFRIAIYVLDYWKSLGKNIKLLNFRGEEILPLYTPSLRYSTSMILFSIFDYKNKFGKLPDFEDICNYHFRLSNSLGLIKSGGKYRNWRSAIDNKFVSTLYAALRNLNDLRLINVIKKKEKNKEKIESINLTLNGSLLLLFSDKKNLIIESIMGEQEI